MKKGPRLFEKYMQKKLAFVFILIALALFTLGIVAARISYNDNEEYARIVLAQQDYDSRTIEAQRGNITDRYGTILATNEVYYTLILDPGVMLSKDEYYRTSVAALVEVFGCDEADLRAAIESNPDSHYIRYMNYLSGEQVDAFEARRSEINTAATDTNSLNQVKGVWFETNYKRVYPYGSLACNVLGFASADGEVGTYGIEQYYNDMLVGTDGREYGYLSDVSNVERVTVEPTNGYTICSTIDTVIQQAVETQIANYQQSVGADMIACIVMDPYTSEVLAMATSRPYDLNNPSDVSAYYTQAQLDAMSPEEYVNALTAVWKNYCITETYEPGSTAKVFTTSAAIEEGLVNPDGWSMNCDGGENFPGNVRVNCHLHSGHGTVNAYQALAYSCNDAMMYMARLCGTEVLTQYLQNFGLGMKTGIDLPGEERGIVWDPEYITDLTLCTNSFGQNYNVTMIQMAAAYCALINGGNYYTPHVVNRILDADGNLVRNIQPELVRQVISPETSAFMREALLQAVQYGTGKSAQMAGYNVAGKSGTAQKYPREENNYLISFAGFVPYDDPQVLVYTIMDVPHVDDQSVGGYATMLARDIIASIVDHLGIYPDDAEAAAAAAAQAAAEAANAEAAANSTDGYDTEAGLYEGGNDNDSYSQIDSQEVSAENDEGPAVDDQ